MSFYLPRPEKLKVLTRANLRLGIYQILKMRVPAWAAVNETVHSEKATGRNIKLVNAVLRRIAEQSEGPPLPTDTIKRLSILYSHPEWLVRRYIDRFGVHETERLLEINNTPAPLTLRINRLKSTREEFLKRLEDMGIKASPTGFSPYGVIIEGPLGHETLIGLLDYASVQDEAAQLIVLFLGPEKGQRILDACAAPGGKTSFIYELTEGRAKIVAVDENPSRVSLLRQRLQGTGVDIIQADLRALSFSEPFQRIVLDAPCSSLGVVRKNPDVKFHVTEERLKVLQRKQIELLETSAGFLSPGGVLVYSVCSLEPEETEEVVRQHLNKYTDFFIIKDQPSQCLEPFVNKEGYFYSLPHRHNMDGHFAVRIGRRG
jgi:16S rRNA (cytosine967-C5)-methyltransferase